jgi:lipopolysaccharide transport system permease protein
VRLGVIAWFVRSLAAHRDLLWQMVSTDIRGRYVGSMLGLFWTVLHPLVMIVIYTLVFSRVMGSRLPSSGDPYAFSVYLCSALLPWIAFQDVILRTTTVFPDNAALVRKVAFPKSVLYGAITATSAINFVLAAAAFFTVLLLAGHAFPATVALWVVVTLLQLGFGLGLGIVASVLHVFLRDTAQIVGVLCQLWFWLTPIVYVESVLPTWLQQAGRLNPLRAFALAHRSLVVDGRLPAAGQTLALAGLTAITLAAGTWLYRRFRADILDEL